MQKKVAHILNELIPSGAEKMLYDSNKLWDGLEEYILATQKEEGDYAKQLRDAGYLVVHIYNKNFLKQHIAIYNFFKQEKIDIVHIHRESQSLFYTIDAKLAGIKKIVRTVHSTFLFSGLLRMRRIVTRFLERRLGSIYVAIGESVRDNEQRRFYNPCKKMIFNWCDSSFQFVSDAEKKRNKHEKYGEQDTFVIATVGNCYAIKNHKLIIEALGKLLENKEVLEKTSQQIQYIHIGSGDLEDEEKKYVKYLGIEKNVKFMGRRNPQDILAMTDVYVMLSSYEGCGIAALEALQTGVNVLLSDVVGLRDFKKLNSDNLHYVELNVEKVMDEIYALYKQYLLGELKNSEMQSLHVKEMYDMDKSVKKYREIYGV